MFFCRCHTFNFFVSDSKRQCRALRRLFFQFCRLGKIFQNLFFAFFFNNGILFLLRFCFRRCPNWRFSGFSCFLFYVGKLGQGIALFQLFFAHQLAFVNVGVNAFKQPNVINRVFDGIQSRRGRHHPPLENVKLHFAERTVSHVNKCIVFGRFFRRRRFAGAHHNGKAAESHFAVDRNVNNADAPGNLVHCLHLRRVALDFRGRSLCGKQQRTNRRRCPKFISCHHCLSP